MVRTERVNSIMRGVSYMIHSVQRSITPLKSNQIYFIFFLFSSSYRYRSAHMFCESGIAFEVLK